ncbi:hypothetical protein AFK68_21875 [Hydrocoleum sp. CS-953]|uniref:hypothetical protein n=1 Tax=Hydrocoleum sp. CS-953 TaxID=1671698 RepID=UPI000B9BF255|nr:hypothetical protein [Hydrocoleum sp. CS-953]OZH52824.1 hypothetical protein AFK68_21875 [Hydrocoleum sp. CS-953]
MSASENESTIATSAIISRKTKVVSEVEFSSASENESTIATSAIVNEEEKISQPPRSNFRVPQKMNRLLRMSQ